jgi:hypothetical protein
VSDINAQVAFPNLTLTAEQQAAVELVNTTLAAYPEEQDPRPMLRLAAWLLEEADVAPQPQIAAALGYQSDRSIRHIRGAVAANGWQALFDAPRSGRPGVVTQQAVEQAVIQEILAAIIAEHTLPADEELAQRATRRWQDAGDSTVTLTADQVETIRLHWGIHRPDIKAQLQAASSSQHAAQEQVALGQTRWGGAFVLLAILVQKAWLRVASGLRLAAGYAITAEQLLLTALFAVLCGIRRACHLDGVRDVGWALLTARPRPLSHSAFQHLIHTLPLGAVRRFYQATAQQQVAATADGDLRVSMDGHNVPRYTRLVDLPKTRLSSTGRVEKADEVLTAFDLDSDTFLALRIRRGGKNLQKVVLSLAQELLTHRQGHPGCLRLFLDRGAYKAALFRELKAQPQVHFYCPAVRYRDLVAQWQTLRAQDFAAEPFVFQRQAAQPASERPVYRLADRPMTLNIWEKGRVVDTVTLRAVILHNPQGQTPREQWHVLFTDDEQSPARHLADEFGDHWGHEFAHRIGKHDLCYDILPQSYTLVSQRDEQGQLQRTVTFNIKAIFLVAWLRCLTFNLMTAFGQALGGEYARMWAGTLLRKFVHRPASLLLVGDELHVVFEPFPEQEGLRPLLEQLNRERVAVPWLNGLVLQFFLAEDEPLHPLDAPRMRKRLFGNDKG